MEDNAAVNIACGRNAPTGLVHDLNNALTPVVGYATLLLLQQATTDEGGVTAEYLRRIYTGSKDAQAVVERIRDFYRSRDPWDNIGEMDINRLVIDAVSLSEPRWRAQAEARGVAVSVNYKLASRARAAVDASELRQALVNLIFNAVDAMPDGGEVIVSTSMTGAMVEIAVADTGTGMDDETLRRCMEPFFTTKGDAGTGLGLPMVFGIAKRHQGNLRLQSALGQGTTVTLELPRGKRMAPAAQQDPQQRLGRPPKKLSASLTTLVVDDNPAIVRYLVDCIALNGHRTATALSANEALEILGRDGASFDVVFSDGAMPGLTGYDFVKRIKDLDQRIVTCLVTGFGEWAHVPEEAMRAADYFLRKPVSPEQLNEVLDKVVAWKNEIGGIRNSPP